MSTRSPPLDPLSAQDHELAERRLDRPEKRSTKCRHLSVYADIYYNAFMTELTATALEAVGIGAFFRPRDIEALGVPYRRLRGLVATGAVENLGGGLYRLAEVEPTELETVAMVAAAVPHAIVCLMTALSVYEIGTESPHEVWIAINRKARRPARVPAQIRVVWFSKAMLNYGVVRRRMLGVPVAITSPARTVVDCFRYRNKFGLDTALEALRDVLRQRLATVDEIMRTANVCRARTVLQPYMEAVLS